MRYLLVALTLAACSTHQDTPTRDAAMADAGPRPDADRRTCDSECAPGPCGGSVTTCVPRRVSPESSAFCGYCFPSCPEPNSLICGFAWQCNYPDGGPGGGHDGIPTCVLH